MRLASDVRAVLEGLDRVRYTLRIKGARVTVGAFQDEADLGVEVEEVFERFRREAGDDHLGRTSDSGSMDHVEARIAQLVARQHPEAFAALDAFWARHRGFLDAQVARFDRDVRFYLAYLDLVEPLAAAGLPLCYPDVSDGPVDVRVEDGFDLALAVRLGSSAAGRVVLNGLTLQAPERILVVTGPNQGGKTTFARMIAQIHHLAALGLPVPARAAQLALADRVLTHFEREEDVGTLRGRLEDDLVRVRAIVDQATRASVVVLNETLSSTTLRDAVDLGTRVLERLTALGCLTVWVTFVDELASFNEATREHGRDGRGGRSDPAHVRDRAPARRRPGLRVGARGAPRPDLRAAARADRAVRVRLMHAGRDVDLEQPQPLHADALARDLGLGSILDAMARGDAFLRAVAEHALLASLEAPDAIRYRQGVLADCLAQPAVARELYALAVEGVESKQAVRHFWFRDSPDTLLAKSLRILELLTDVLRRLRGLVDAHGAAFASEGLSALASTLQRDLDDAYLERLDEVRGTLELRPGALISARLGRANRGAGYVLRRPRVRSLRERLMPGGPASSSFVIAARDEHGLQSLGELRGRGIEVAAGALAQSVDHILGFLALLRAELGFYVACLNLHDELAGRGLATCFPDPRAGHETTLVARGLYDPALALHLAGPIVGNDVDAEGKRLLLVTGANQGGKSTFLRSLGSAQLMLQAGMFAPAAELRANVCSAVLTHFRREEDPSMTHGRLDEELRRMSEIAGALRPAGLVLCNESFSATNEREGSEIARQVVLALAAAGVKVVLVTHLYELAEGIRRDRDPERAASPRRAHARWRAHVPGRPGPTARDEPRRGLLRPGLRADRYWPVVVPVVPVGRCGSSTRQVWSALRAFGSVKALRKPPCVVSLTPCDCRQLRNAASAELETCRPPPRPPKPKPPLGRLLAQACCAFW